MGRKQPCAAGGAAINSRLRWHIISHGQNLRLRNPLRGAVRRNAWSHRVRPRCRIQQRRPRVQFTFAMAISQTEVRYIAELARLQLSEAELAEYALQLSAVLDYAASLNALDLAGVPPTTSVLALHTVLRADEARPAMDRDELLANAADTAAGCFRVPPVLE